MGNTQSTKSNIRTNSIKKKTPSTIIFGIVILLVALATCAASIQAQGDPPKKTIEGVWRVNVTPRICATGVPIPAAAFEALLTFHKDGTLSAWFQNRVITTTRSPGYGLWQRGVGWNDYKFGFTHFRYDPASGTFIGRQDATATLVLSDSGEEFLSDGMTALFDAAGNSQGGGCSNSVGTRFSLEP